MKRTKSTSCAVMLQIGATKDTVDKVTGSILAIMKADVSDAVKIKGLDVFDGSLRVENTNIHDCSFVSN